MQPPMHSYAEQLRRLRLRRRGALGLATAGVAASVLAGCSSRGRSGAAATPGSAAKPKAGGQISAAQANDPVNFDTSTKLVDAARALAACNEPLMSFKSGSSVKYQDLVIQPGLAMKWENPDPQTYTFHLRNDVKWQNVAPVNGRAFDASDVKWTYEYMSRLGPAAKLPPAPAASMFAGVDRIDAPDASTVVVHFSQPFAPFQSYAASEWIPILAHEIFDADGDFKRRAAGTGAFILDLAQWQKGTRLTYPKNPNYWRPGLPYVDALNLLILADQATINSAFQARQLDILDYSGLDGRTADAMKKAVPNIVVDRYADSNDAYYIYFNVTKPPINDDRVRKAISLSIDRDELIQTLFNGQGQWSLAGGTPDLFSQEEVKQILKYDPAQAKQLLAAAGYPNGVDIEFIYNAAYGDTFTIKAQLLQSQLKKGGINLTLKPLLNGEDAQRRRSGDFQFNITPRGQGVPQDIDSYVYGMFHPKSADNYGRINDPQLTPLLEAQRAELDPNKRRELVRRAVQRINEVPWSLTLFYGPGYSLRQQRLQNYAPNVAYPYGWMVTESWVQQ
jgi:peptide/nickel transport system substrate-binding protein